jgi:hypothetical protein
MIVWENGSGGSNFSSHVANRCHTSAGDGVHSWTKVFYYRAGAT